MQRVVTLEKAKERFQDLENEAHSNLSGGALAERLDQLRVEKLSEVESIQNLAEAQGR